VTLHRFYRYKYTKCLESTPPQHKNLPNLEIEKNKPHMRFIISSNLTQKQEMIYEKRERLHLLQEWPKLKNAKPQPF
jgi:hypothetical protein